MSQDIERLKKEVSQFSGIDDKERKEILSDLRYLEESNKKYAQMKLDDIERKYKATIETAIAVCLFVVAIALYILYGFFVTR